MRQVAVVDGDYDFGRSFASSIRELTKHWPPGEDVPRQIVSARIEPVEFLRPKEICITGVEMVRRACDELNAAYGEQDAQWLLEHQREIPQELRPFRLVFARATRRTGASEVVLVLEFEDDAWHPDFEWLNEGFGGSYRLFRPAAAL